MSNVFSVKPIKVPGLLSDEGLAAGVKEMVGTTKKAQDQAPMPNAAVGFADKFLKDRTAALGKAVEMVRHTKGIPGLQPIAVLEKPLAASLRVSQVNDVAQQIQSAFPGNDSSQAIVAAGTLSPEEQAKEQASAVKAAAAQVTPILEDMARVRLNEGMTDAEREAQGIPPVPFNPARQGNLQSELNDALGNVTLAETTPRKQTWWLNAAQVSIRALAHMGVSTIRYPVDFWENLGNPTISIPGGPMISGAANEQAAIYLDGIDQALTKMLPGDPGRAKEFVTQLSQGAATMSGFMIAGYVGRALEVPAWLISGGLGAATEGDAVYQDAKDFDANAVQKWFALIGGSGLGATEAAPIERMFFRADVATGGAVHRLLANSQATSLEEFIQEYGQAFGEDMVAKYGGPGFSGYDYKRTIDPGSWLQQGLVGGITGAAAGAVGELSSTLLDGTSKPVAKIEPTEIAATVKAVMDEEDARFDSLVGDEINDLTPEEGGPAPTPEEGTGTIQPPAAVPQVTAPRDSPVDVGDAITQIAEAPARAAETEAVHAEAVRKEIETPEFKNFFKDSKAVSPEGKPLRLVHATATKKDGNALDAPVLEGEFVQDFGVFRTNNEMGAHFGTAEQATSRVGRREGRRSFPVYVSIQNPLRVQDPGSFNASTMLVQPQVALAVGSKAAGEILDVYYHDSSKKADEMLRKALQKAGYDGLVYLNRGEALNRFVSSTGFETNDAQFKTDYPEADDSFVVFDPRQVKSAIANVGTFDPNSAFIDQTVGHLPISRQELDAIELEPSELQQLPNTEKGLPGPLAIVVKAARAYAAAAGIPLRRQREYVRVDVARAGRIAQAYTDMKHEPQHPVVLEAYQAMAEETVAQYQYVKATGLVIDPIPKGAENPYGSPREVLADIANGHIWYFRTEDGFGVDETVDVSDNPLLEATGEKDASGNVMLVNDVFRVVHDFFGHGMEGSGFGPRGEENAWQSHMRLYSASAVPAMTSETRGQNSWVNFGPYGEQNRANPKDTHYADQKSGLMPSWTWQEGVYDTSAYGVSAPVEVTDAKAFRDAFAAAKASQKYGVVANLYSTQKYAKMRMFLTPDGFSGFALDGEDIVSVFSHINAPRGRLRQLIDAAVANGGRTLDAFDTGLPAMYRALGFVETRREPWNDKFAPEGWPYDELGRPGVVYMAYQGAEIENTVARSVSPKVLEKVSGLKPVLKHMTPAEQKRVTAKSAEKLVEIFDTVPDPKEFAAVAISGRAKRGWYQRSAEALVDIFGHTDAPRFAALLAALSPQSSVEMNAINALNVWVAWEESGRPIEERQILAILNMNVIQGEGSQSGKGSTLGAWKNNSVRALSAEDPTEVKLSGPKVDSFMRNLRGYVNEVTNDTWMAQYAGIDQKVFQGTPEKVEGDEFKTMLGKGGGYIAMSAAVRAAAQYASKMTGDVWTPAEIQETIWSWARTLYLKARSNDTTISAILKAGDITHEEIGSTPDFSTLFVSGVYRKILERGGYYRGISAAEGRSQASDGVDDQAGSPVSAEGTKIAQRTFERYLQRAAERLDSLLADERQGRSSRALEPETPSPYMTDEDRDVELTLGTSNARAPFKGEPTRPTKGIPVKPDDTTPDDLSLSKISKQFIALLNLTVRHGRLAATGKGASKVMGEYNRRQRVIRLRNASDLSSLVHEGGHALNDMMGQPLIDLVRRNEATFEKIARRFYAELPDQPTPEFFRREGFAEFFRLYVLSPALVRKDYGALVTDFEATVKANDPKLIDQLSTITNRFRAYQKAPSARIMENMIVDGQREQGLNPAFKELKEKGFKSWFYEFVRRGTEATVNRYVPVFQLVAEIANVAEAHMGVALDVKYSEHAGVLMQMARNVGSRAHVQLSDGVIGYHSTQSFTRGLREAIMIAMGLDPNSTPGGFDTKRMKAFGAYLAELRSLDEYRRQGLGLIARAPVSLSEGEIIQGINDHEKAYPSFKQAAAIVHDYAMGLWQKQYDAGLMTKEVYETGKERQFYVPLQRDMSDKLEPTKEMAFGRSAINKSRFKGSDRDIIHPLAILMQKTFALEKVIAENDAIKSLAMLAERAGGAGALVENIPASKMVASTYSVRELAIQLTNDEDITEEDAADLMTMLQGSIEKGNMLTLFRRKQAEAMGENILFYWREGKIAAIQLKDKELGAQVVNAMNAVGRENMDLPLEMLAGASTVFRTAITSWPDFLLMNFIRGEFQSIVLSGVGYVPFFSGLRGMRDEIRQKDWAKLYNVAGGIMGGMNVAALHDARVDRDINSLRAKGYWAQVFGDKTPILGAIRGLGRLTALSETGNRLGVFRPAYERGIKEGLSEYDAAFEASYIATDLMDYGLNGSKMLGVRRLVPFLNAQLQGLYKMTRTLTGGEVQRRKGLLFVLGAYFKNTNGLPLSRTEKQQLNTGRKAWLMMMGLALVSAALYFLFKDDPDYQEASEYLRTTGWVIPIGNGRIVYIPKPFELAVLANATERGLEAAAGDQEAPGRFMRSVMFMITPPTTPPAIGLAIEAAVNRDFYTGQEIVPGYMQALPGQLQFDRYTTNLAKWVGGITGWSPMLVDHWLGGLGASAYRDVTGLINAGDPTRPAQDETDWPILRRVVRDVRRGSVSAQDFWAQASQTSGVLEHAHQGYKHFMDIGDEVAANRFLDGLPADQRAYAILMTSFKPEEKRLNPFYRAAQVTSIISGLRRQMASAESIENTLIKDFPEAIPLSAAEKGQLDETLSELARREVRNTLIATGQPGWRGKAILPVEPTLDMLLQQSPEVYDEYMRRVTKAKVYDAQTVYDYWPEVQGRLIADKEFAVLADAVAVAGAMVQ